MAVALIVAAGRGERLGSGRPGSRPKALVTLAGRPMLEWSVDALRDVPAVRQIVVALPPDSVDAAPAGTVGVAGGDVRSGSVRLALAAAGPGDPVIVHDAARPLARAALFDRAVSELQRTGADAVVAARPVADTIKEVGDASALVRRTLARERLWAAQTPQVFKRTTLERALAAEEELLRAATDDAWLVERAGGVVRVLDSGQENMKITTPEDLRMAEVLLGG